MCNIINIYMCVFVCVGHTGFKSGDQFISLQLSSLMDKLNKENRNLGFITAQRVKNREEL